MPHSANARSPQGRWEEKFPVDTGWRSRVEGGVEILRLAIRLGLLLVAAGCQNGSRVEAPPKTPHRLLALITTYDPPGSFHDLEATLQRNAAALPGVDFASRRVASLDGWYDALQDDQRRRGSIDTLVLAFHGHPGKLHFGPRDGVHQRNLERSLAGISAYLHPEARVLLYACLTGEGEDNLAKDLADVLDREVMAPHYFWLMQTAIPLEERVLELAREPTGRLTVAADRFALFYKRRMDSGRDRYLIAPAAMAPLCRQDGFERRASRFRVLFEIYRP